MRIFKIACIAAVSTFVAMGLVVLLLHQYGTGSSSSDEETTLVSTIDKSLVAATYGDTTVYEYEIDNYSISLRNYYSMTSDSTWLTYLAYYFNGSAEEFRTEIINNVYLYNDVLEAAAESEGVTVADEDIDAAVAKMRAKVDSDDEWTEMLESAGYTEETYRAAIRQSMLDSALMDKVAPLQEATETEWLDAAKSYKSAYNGMKRSSHILFAETDEELAKTVKAQLEAGEITWSDAVTKYSTDTGSASKDGDCGWDDLNSFVSEYDDALEELEVGEISDPVLSTYGYHLIKCTEVWNAPETITSMDQMPSELQELIKKYVDNYVMPDKQEEAYDEWLENFRNGLSDYVINPMPEGLTYDVEEEEETATDTDASEESEADADADADAE